VCKFGLSETDMEVGLAVAANDVVELHEMDPQEAEDYLRKSLVRKQLLQNEAMTAELLRELTYLPLAITQAAAYLNRNGQVSVRKYRELLRGTEQDIVSLMSREFHDNTRYHGSRNAVATTWLVSFEQIQTSDPAAAGLLSFISCIEPKAIPRSLFPASGSHEEMEFANGTLSGYTFLVKGEDDGDEVYDMHSLVHLATRIWIRKQGQTEETIVRAIQHLNAIFPPAKPTNRQTWESYLPHTFRLLNTSRTCQLEERFSLAHQVRKCLQVNYETGLEEAIGFLKMSFNRAMKRLAPIVITNRSPPQSEHDRTTVFLDTSLLKEAIEISRHVDDVLIGTPGKEHHSATGRQLQAIFRLIDHAVDNGSKILSQNDHTLLSSLYELARAWATNNGRFKDAIQMMKHMEEIENGMWSEKHSLQPASEHGLASSFPDNIGAEEDQILELVTHLLLHIRFQLSRRSLIN
jgi:hypothetical protein